MQGPAGLAAWIAEVNAMGALADDDSGNQRLQVQGLMIEDPRGLRVGGVVELKASIEDEVVDDVTAHPTTDSIG